MLRNVPGEKCPPRGLAILHAPAWFAVIFSFLLPIWLFRYFPTQDGPAHLANSLILRDYIVGDARVQQFYWINWRPLPNWSCSVLLASLCCFFQPLAAEKLLVSLYLLGFAWSYWYFVGALGRDASLLSLAGFLLAFNRCLWMGFYNYCLSLIGFFIMLGYLLRRWERFRPQHAFVLCALIGLVYFTHLVGFILSAMCCLWVAVTVRPRSLRKVSYIVAILVPGLVLASFFFREGRFAGEGGFSQLHDYLRGWIQWTGQLKRLDDDCSNLEANLYGIYLDPPVTLGMGVGLLCYLFILAGFCATGPQTREEKSRRRAVAVLGGTFALLYFLVPDMLVFGKGGFWKARLAPLPPLLWLACVRLPSVRVIRRALTVGTLVLLGVNLGLVSSFVRTGNLDIREFTSGLEGVGQGRVIVFHIVGGGKWRVDPLSHAGDYYCLNSGNINLSHHFASLLHSVVRLRRNLVEEDGDIENYSHRDLVDTIVVWDEDSSPYIPHGFALVFRHGRLKLLRKSISDTQQPGQ